MGPQRYLTCLLVFASLIWTTPGAQAAPNQAGTELKIGFWNVRDLSLSSRDDDELKQIALVAHSIDCLAICEVNDGSVLKKLTRKLKALGGKWKRVQTRDKVGNTPQTAERYGFVFRSDKVRVRGKPYVLHPLPYSVEDETTPREFDREPFVCTFTTLDGRFDFTVMVVHVTWGQKAAYRIAEVCALGNYFSFVQGRNNRDDDVILCGDFNRNVGDLPSLGTLLSSIPGLIDTTSPVPPTVIDTANTYDHLLFQTNFVREYTGDHGVISFDETMFGDNDALAETVCSDHRPVWARMLVPSQDDD